MKLPSWKVMGILNVTPDSFFDGGVYGNDLPATIDRAASMIRDGASILDVGGESTRPGAHPVGTQEELDRVIPVIESLKSRFDCMISVDTTKSVVARIACNSGAHWINDITAGQLDSEMSSVCAELGVTVVLMHSRKTPQTMQMNISYVDVVNEVVQELLTSANTFICWCLPNINNS